MARKPKGGGPGLRTECPFSGEPLVFATVRTLSAGHLVDKIQVRGVGWVSTRLFDSRAEAEWFFSHANGQAPDIPNPHRRVVVAGVCEPPDPAEADVRRTVRHHEGLVEDAAEVLK